MSNNISEQRKVEQKREQWKDALASAGIDPDAEDEDTEIESLENEPEQSDQSDDDLDVTADVLKGEMDMDLITLNDSFAVDEKLEKLNRKVSWYDRNDVTPPGNLKAKRDALAKIQEGKPEGGYGSWMDVRLDLGEGRR